MGKKAIKVAVKNSKDNAEVARPAWTGNTSETISSLSPSVRKILTGLSVGQIMIVAVSAATLGAFVNSNVRFYCLPFFSTSG